MNSQKQIIPLKTITATCTVTEIDNIQQILNIRQLALLACNEAKVEFDKKSLCNNLLQQTTDFF